MTENPPHTPPPASASDTGAVWPEPDTVPANESQLPNRAAEHPLANDPAVLRQQADFLADERDHWREKANPLAAELRQILDEFDGSRSVYQRLLRLAEHVEAAGATAETTVTGELDVTADGLSAEQKLRDYAIEHVLHRHQVNDSHLLLSQVWPEADRFAAYVRDGRHPAPATVCTCRQAAPPAGLGTVELDGQDVSAAVDGVELRSHVGQLTEATLHLPVVELDAEADVRLLMPDATRALLVAAGWTPPEGSS